MKTPSQSCLLSSMDYFSLMALKSYASGLQIKPLPVPDSLELPMINDYIFGCLKIRSKAVLLNCQVYVERKTLVIYMVSELEKCRNHVENVLCQQLISPLLSITWRLPR